MASVVDGRSHSLGGMKVGVVQHHAHRVHLLQIERHRPLDERPAGNPRRRGVIYLPRTSPARGLIPAQDQRALGLRVHLPVGPVKRSHEKNAALERARIPGRGNGNVHLVPRPAEGRQNVPPQTPRPCSSPAYWQPSSSPSAAPSPPCAPARRSASAPERRSASYPRWRAIPPPVRSPPTGCRECLRWWPHP
jgi:hypothetical protein